MLILHSEAESNIKAFMGWGIKHQELLKLGKRVATETGLNFIIRSIQKWKRVWIDGIINFSDLFKIQLLWSHYIFILYISYIYSAYVTFLKDHRNILLSICKMFINIQYYQQLFLLLWKENFDSWNCKLQQYSCIFCLCCLYWLTDTLICSQTL